MRTSRPIAPAAEPAGPLAAWARFWFTPADPVALHGLRVLAGLLFLAWLLPFAGHVPELFGLDGWFDRQAYAEAARLPDGPPKPIGWSILFPVGNDARLLTAVYWLSIAVLVLFTLGVAARLTAVATWIIVTSFTVNPALDYDADALLLVIALYLMVGYVLASQRRPGQSWAARIVGPRDFWLLGQGPAAATESQPSLGANVALRLLQVHFAILIVISGLHKLQFGDWWAGVALWYPLYPPLETTPAQARAWARGGQQYLFVLSLMTYCTLAWQLTFPLFAWKPRGRWLLLGGAVVGWLGTALLYRLPLFGPALLIGCLSFVPPESWQRTRDKLGGLFSRARGNAPRMEDAESVAVGGRR